MKNIYIIPTDKPSRLVIDTIENKLYYQPILHDKTVNVLPQNIYITNDEKPKQGEWSLYQNKIHKCIEDIIGDEFKKIILTTDQELINNGVQPIDDEFLEWFVKNPACEEIKTVYEPKNFLDTSQGWEYLIIILKEEPKQEALEDVVKNFINKYYSGEVYERDIEEAIKFGTKWQQERMYSEEEVIAIVEKSRETGLTAECLLLTKQFKKK